MLVPTRFLFILQAFEASCFEGREVPEKRKKEQFRKLVSGIVGVRIIRNGCLYTLLSLVRPVERFSNIKNKTTF